MHVKRLHVGEQANLERERATDCCILEVKVAQSDSCILDVAANAAHDRPM